MKQWTIMVYMAGDNNLSEDMVSGLIGMKKNLEASFDADAAFLAYYDTGALAFPTVRCDFTKTPDDAGSKEKTAAHPTGSPFIEPDANEKTSAESIYEFIKWCVETRGHEAENYALIFSGHGDGFQPDTFLSDANPVSSLTVPGLRKILKKAEKDFLGGRKLDVIGFDSCVMGTLEVAYELADVADLMVASQGLVPNNGWDYAIIAEEIGSAHTRGEKLAAEALAALFARSFIRAYWDYAFYSARSVDVAVCDLRKIGALGKAVCELGESLSQALDAAPEAAAKIERAILASHHAAQTHVFEQCVDTFDFCAVLQAECVELLEEAEAMAEIIQPSENTDGIRRHFEELAKVSRRIADACAAVMQQLDRCVRESLYLGAEFQYSNGLSLYFPWSYVSYLISKERYLKRDFAARGKNKDKLPKPSGWTQFLEDYLSQTMRAPRRAAAGEFFLFDLPEKNLGETEKEAFRLNSSYDHKLNSSYNHKLNSSYNHKLNSSYNHKLNSSYNHKLNSSYNHKLNSSYNHKLNSASEDDRLNSTYNKLNSTYNKLNSPYNKLNSPYNKLNSTYNKLNSTYNKLLGASPLGDFGRTKNFPWAPTLWHPNERLTSEEEPEEQS